MLNNVTLMGRLVADPELRMTQSGTPVTSFRIAVDRNFVRQGAERETDFIGIVAWKGTAEFVEKYFRKGQMIAVQGSLQSRQYTDKQDNKRTVIEVSAREVYFADSKAAPKDTESQANGYEEIEDNDLPFN